jgi:hypothetical protein
MEKTVKCIEFRNALHVPKTDERDDIHFVSELVTFDDGSIERRLRRIVNYERPFFITKKIFRKHNQKKEYEEFEKVTKFTSTQSELANNIARKLGREGYCKNQIRDIQNNPYVYWGSLASTTILKYQYAQRYESLHTEYRVAVMDIENDVITGEITVNSVSTDEELHCYVNSAFISNYSDKEGVKKRVRDLYIKNAPNVDIEKSIKEDVKIYETSGGSFDMYVHISHNETGVIRDSMAKLHSLRADINTGWNFFYDVNTIKKRCELNGLDHLEIFSDPEVLPNERFYKVIEPNPLRLTNAGKEVRAKPHELWYKFYISTYAVWIDSMSAYNFVRSGQANVPGGYGMDNILDVELGYGKLKFNLPGTESLTKAEWHVYMSTKHKLEYIAYNIWDVRGLVELDKKTGDLRNSLPLLSQDSLFDIFNSQPRKLMDSYTFFLLKHNKLVGTTALKNKDWGLIGPKDWIVTLDGGLKPPVDTSKILKENPGRNTGVRKLVMDLDVTAAYPSLQVVFNISQLTTKRELIRIGDFAKEYMKKENINVVGGPANHWGYMSRMCNAPTPMEVDSIMNKLKEKENV